MVMSRVLLGGVLVGCVIEVARVGRAEEEGAKLLGGARGGRTTAPAGN
jgi:hypothetical protein